MSELCTGEMATRGYRPIDGLEVVTGNLRIFTQIYACLSTLSLQHSLDAV